MAKSTSFLAIAPLSEHGAPGLHLQMRVGKLPLYSPRFFVGYPADRRRSNRLSTHDSLRGAGICRSCTHALGLVRSISPSDGSEEGRHDHERAYAHSHA